jgi:ABC-2 type transport system ATP-binding protein
VIIINNGKLVTADTPENLKNRLQRSMVVDLTVRGEIGAIRRALESLTDINSVTLVETTDANTHTIRVESHDNRDIREALSRAVVERGFGLLGLNTIDLSLEEIFVQLVTREELE